MNEGRELTLEQNAEIVKRRVRGLVRAWDRFDHEREALQKGEYINLALDHRLTSEILHPREAHLLSVLEAYVTQLEDRLELPHTMTDMDDIGKPLT